MNFHTSDEIFTLSHKPFVIYRQLYVTATLVLKVRTFELLHRRERGGKRLKATTVTYQGHTLTGL